MYISPCKRDISPSIPCKEPFKEPEVELLAGKHLEPKDPWLIEIAEGSGPGVLHKFFIAV